MPSSATDIIAAIESATGNAARPLALHEPIFSGHEKAYVSSCIDEGWVSSVGAFVDRFERDLATACGSTYAVAVVNGTAALHVALYAMGVEPDDEVLIPSLTFVATANAVMHAGAIPHFVEVEEESLGIDPEKLETYLKENTSREGGLTISKASGRIVRALMPVHIFGHPCQMDKLRRIAKEWNLVLIEDATEALGSLVQGKPVGHSGTAVFSFNGNKIITTGGGGAIVTDDETLAKRIKHLTTTAKQPHAWAFSHDEIAWNYRLPNLNAALGCAQLEQLPQFVAAKRALAARYIEVFSSLSSMKILREPNDTKSNYWLVTLLTDTADSAWLEETLGELHKVKILCRPIWTPLHQLPMYEHCPRAPLALTDDVSKRIISLPSSVKLGLHHD